MLFLYFSFTVVLSVFVYSEKYEKKSEKILRDIKDAKTTWEADPSSPLFDGKEPSELKKFLGIKEEIHLKRRKQPDKKAKRKPEKGKLRGKSQSKGKGKSSSRQKRQFVESLPINFDWRNLTNCQSLFHIRYQTCVDCWALSAAAGISDRYCLFTGKNKYFSTMQTVACTYPGGGGCDGGYPEDAMQYYYKNGIASGGDPTLLAESPGCLPYPYQMTNQIACPKTCTNGSAMDLSKAGDYETMTNGDVGLIQTEIYEFGPVVAVFYVFDDFYRYKSGVYQHISGDPVGWHSLRLIGWGVERGAKYWLAANTWGPNWGERGYVKVLRGSNHMDIEGSVSYAYPIEAFILL